MSIKDFMADVGEEAEAILSSEFGINVVETTTVPEIDDPAITYPNVDTRELGCKLIQTCVLYIDIRRSTELSLQHKPQTVARLYSAFVRSMIRCAEYNDGKVRGIIGDRVMVLYDTHRCFTNAVNTAILMNTVVHQVIDRHFKHNDVTAGIGIDFGRMLVAKTGLIKYGAQNSSYKNLVWLGHPANIASKLTDLANKERSTTEWFAEEYHDDSTPILPPRSGGFGLDYNALAAILTPPPKPEAIAGLFGSPFGSPSPPPIQWRTVKVPIDDFVRKLNTVPLTPNMTHPDATFRFAIPTQEKVSKPRSAQILVTNAVYRGFVKESPDHGTVQGKFWKVQPVRVPGHKGMVFGIDAVRRVEQ
jgi:adenylate cyclase